MGPTIHEKGCEVELGKKTEIPKKKKKRNFIQQIISLFPPLFIKICAHLLSPSFIAFPVLLFHCDIPSGWAGKHIPHHSKKEKILELL